MNGLAQILRARGYQVQGSDSTTSPFTERLGELGIPVAIGQKAENIGDADLVVYSAAIKPDNPGRKPDAGAYPSLSAALHWASSPKATRR